VGSLYLQFGHRKWRSKAEKHRVLERNYFIDIYLAWSDPNSLPHPEYGSSIAISMFTVILRDSTLKELDRTFHVLNEQYLVQHDKTRFDLLSRLNVLDIDVFSVGDMDRLGVELQLVKSTLNNISDADHVDQIVSMTLLCRRIPGSTLVFNPLLA